MRAGMLALAIGLVLPRFLPDLPPGWVLGLLVLLGLCGLAFARRLRCLAWCPLGVAWACLHAQWALDEQLMPALDDRTFWVEGRVVALPERGEGWVRFVLDDVVSRHAGVPARLRLTWTDGPVLRAGERWRVAARLKRPHGLANVRGFDQEAWLLAQRIGAVGSVKSGHRLAPALGADGWRDAVRQHLLASEAHGRGGALAALVVGDAGGLSPEDWQVLQDTGTVHLMVISGQHVSLLAGLLYGLVAGLARRGWWPRRLPWLSSACALALVGALGYGGLAGFETPVLRACVMVAAVLFWRLRFRHLGVWLPMLLALDLVLLIDPLASLENGFWLSFVAVALLAFVFAGRLGHWGTLHSLWRAQWSLALGLLPAMLALDLPVSLSGPLANLVAVPLVGLLVVPLALLGTVLLPVPGVGETLLGVAGLLLNGLFALLGQMATWQSAWQPAALSAWQWGVVTLGVFWLLLPAGVPVRGLGVALLLPLAYPATELPAAGRAEVWMLDVGQGLAVLIRTREHSLLYDAGPRYGASDAGARVVVPSLRALGVGRLDTLLLSHADLDHVGGAATVVAALKPARLIVGEAVPGLADTPNCHSGAHWTWEGVDFRLWQWARAKDGNAASCVLLVEAAGERLLLTGDLDTAGEAALLQSGLPLAARWLQLAHHGSRSASSQRFLAAVNAEFGLVSRSRYNAFGHPHPEVTARALQLGMSLLDTAHAGALRFELGRFGRAGKMREQVRFWRQN